MLSIAVSLLLPFDCPPLKTRRKVPVADGVTLKVGLVSSWFEPVVIVNVATGGLVKVPPGLVSYRSVAVLKPLPLLSTAKLNENCERPIVLTLN